MFALFLFVVPQIGKMWQTLLLVALCVAPASSQLTLRDQTCDADRKRVNVQTVNANVLIGGLFDIRGSGTDGTGCGLPTTGEFRSIDYNEVSCKEERFNTTFIETSCKEGR